MIVHLSQHISKLTFLKRNFMLELRFLISCTNENESLVQYFCGTNEVRDFAKLLFKGPQSRKK